MGLLDFKDKRRRTSCDATLRTEGSTSLRTTGRQQGVRTLSRPGRLRRVTVPEMWPHAKSKPRWLRRATVPGAGNCTSVPDAKNRPSRQAGNCTGSNKQVTDPASERDVDLRFQAFREGLGFEGLGGDARSGNF